MNCNCTNEEKQLMKEICMIKYMKRKIAKLKSAKRNQK